jgi:hypothetical protein
MKKVVSKNVREDVNSYIGREGELFFDPENPDLRFSDGTTPGGIQFSGGTSSTGDITFNGIQIVGAGSGSGDGNGYSTIEIVPDATLYANDQYLIIDPTQPSHIHIRAGGTQDASNAELILGGENNHVSVLDGNGVRILNSVKSSNFYYYTSGVEFNTGTWYEDNGTYYVQYTIVDLNLDNITFQFNNDDENRLTVWYNNNQNSQTLTSAGSISNLGGNVYRVSVNEAPPANPTTLSAFEYELFTVRSNSLELTSNDFRVEVSDDVRIFGADTFRLHNYSSDEPIAIITDYDDNGYTWEFRADGTLSFPDNTVQTTAYVPGIFFTDGSTGGGVGTETAIDLTNQIHKLSSGIYTLADGAEGQMIYLVPQTNATHAGITVIVANGRVLDESAAATVYTNIEFYPFSDTLSTAIKNVVTMIFTDGAWQASSGTWD